MLAAILIGFAFGFIGSLPIAGPITALIFVRSLDGRFRNAVQIGLGSVLAETAYAFLAFWGFSALLTDNAWLEPVSLGVAAAILLGLGVSFILRRTPATPPEVHERAGTGFFVGLAISGLNPTLLATWAGATTTLYSTGLVADFHAGLAAPFAIGAGAGILTWYLILVRLIRRHRERFRPETLNKVIRWFGVFLIGVAGWFAARLVDALV